MTVGLRSISASRVGLLVALVICVTSLGADASGPKPSLPGDQSGLEVGAFGDWKKICEVPPGSTERVCFIFQKVNFAETDSMLLQAVVGYFRADLTDPVLILTAPLGTFLPPGLEVRVPGSPALNSHFEVCMAVGCQASLRLDASRLAVLSRAATAEVLVRDGAKKQVSIPLSLKGLMSGLESLKAKAPK